MRCLRACSPLSAGGSWRARECTTLLLLTSYYFFTTHLSHHCQRAVPGGPENVPLYYCYRLLLFYYSSFAPLSAGGSWRARECTTLLLLPLTNFLLLIFRTTVSGRFLEGQRMSTSAGDKSSSSAFSVSICIFLPVKQVKRASSAFSVSICIFLPVKQVKRVPSSAFLCEPSLPSSWVLEDTPLALPSLCVSMYHTCIHTDRHRHRHRHRHNIRLHCLRDVSGCMYTHTPTHPHEYTYRHINIPACPERRWRRRMGGKAAVCVCVCVCACQGACLALLVTHTHTHTHTNTHTHAHARTHTHNTHTHTHLCLFSLLKDMRYTTR